jgi:ribose transport system permease protein
MLAVGAALALLLRFTIFGQRCFVVGDNPRAAGLSGLGIARTRTAALAISGVAAAIAGIVIASSDGLIYPGTGERFLLQALAAVVIGGTALRGGAGTVVGALLGIFLLGIVDNGLNLVGVPGVWQDVLRGLILVGALVLDRLRESRL